MQKDYRNWLIQKGFSVKTANNKPSTVYDYIRGIKFVCHEENICIEQVAEKIDELLPLYRKGGEYEHLGRQISRSVRSSLNQFSKFLMEQRA